MSKLSIPFLAVDSLPSWVPIHHFNEPKYNYSTGADLVDISKKSLWAFVAMVVFNPVFWNTVARNELRNKTITKIFGSPLYGTYFLAVTIFSISAFRDHLFLNAVHNQPALAILAHPAIKTLAATLFIAGQTFVLSSMWVLGVTGTYLGDYFGILMSERVTGFPFNILSDPMYVGSALSHLGTALWFQSPVGVALAGWVYVVYAIALKFEGPYTDAIYSAKTRAGSPTRTTSAAPSVPVTPSRRSGRIAAKSSHSDLDSDADIKPTTTPGRTKGRSSALKDELAAATGAPSPRRSTRSRSKGRVSSDLEL